MVGEGKGERGEGWWMRLCVRKMMVCAVVQSRLGDSENLRLDRQDRVVNITARVNG